MVISYEYGDIDPPPIGEILIIRDIYPNLYISKC